MFRRPFGTAATPPDGAGDDPAAATPLNVAVSLSGRDIAASVRRAVDRANVALAFQPVVQVRGEGRVAFYEGLIRLIDDGGRIIPAREFIDHVEATETGRRIDCLALEMGLASLAEAPGLRLAINMSARSIGYAPWIRTLDQGLAACPTAAERLILEITESSAMLMPELVVAFMQDIRHRGISFALDDFGAGYTSFRYLRQFTFDMLKIDGQFVRSIAASPDNQVLVEALVSIARHFDMFTVAEAVETGAEAAMLTAMGIDCMQGYYFGAPTLLPPWHRADQRATA